MISLLSPNDIGNYSVTLSKIYPMGSDDLSHTVTPDMQEIIKGIKVLE